MTQIDWRPLRDPHERLRWARMRWQLQKGIKPEAGAAADSLGMNQHTYRAHERAPGASKHIALDHQRAIQFGRKFGVNWQWLLTGNGSPDDMALSDVEARIIQAFRDAPESRQGAVAAAIEALLRSA